MADTSLADLIADLGSARRELLAEVEKLRPDQLDARAKPGEWDVRQIVEHMTYAERRYLTNVSAIRVALGLNDSADLDSLLAEWRRAREALLDEVSRVAPEQLEERIPGNDRTIREWLTMAINHDRAHAVQLREINAAAR